MAPFLTHPDLLIYHTCTATLVRQHAFTNVSHRCRYLFALCIYRQDSCHPSFMLQYTQTPNFHATFSPQLSHRWLNMPVIHMALRLNPRTLCLCRGANLLFFSFSRSIAPSSRLFYAPLVLGKGMRSGHDSQDKLPRDLESAELPLVPAHLPGRNCEPSS